jgi:hypothetical protein
MWRIAAIALICCSGCAGEHEECLWHDSFVGDLYRCVCGNHENKAAATSSDGTAVSTGDSASASTSPASSSTPAKPMDKVP